MVPPLVRLISSNARSNARIAARKPPLRMIIFGKPGAGKGTLSTRLIEKYDVEQISTGDLLRAEVQARTDLGRQAEGIMASGGIVDASLVLRLVSSKLNQLMQHGVQNWILDGFPRTLEQGRLLDPLLRQLSCPLSLVVNLDVPDEVILSRIQDRWTHLKSGRVYNLSYNRPKVPGLDDITGEPLSKRPDDNPEVAARRLQAFYTTTSPLLSYYSSQAITLSPSSPSTSYSPELATFGQVYLTEITGRTSDEIWPKMEDVIRRNFGVRVRSGAKITGGLGVGTKKGVDANVGVAGAVAGNGKEDSVGTTRSRPSPGPRL